MDEDVVRQLIPKLKAAKAQGIVEYPLNKIVLVMRIVDSERESAAKKILAARRRSDADGGKAWPAKIIADVRRRGDAALFAWTRSWTARR